MARKTYKNQTSSRGSLFIPLLVTLVLLVVSGILVISYFYDFYHTEKTHEATLLARTYANTLESTLDARSLLTEQFHATLRVAGNIVSRQEKPFSNEMLAELARTLNVDVFYVYDNEMRIRYSSDNLYIGWVAPEGHPVRTFYESGQDHYVDEIRTDTETDTYWLYSYQRYADGRMIQSGILADKLAELYAQLNEQAIIDKIAQKSPQIQISFINLKGLITASSIPEEIGKSVDESAITSKAGEIPHQLENTLKGFEWHLKHYTPIMVDDTKVGTLALLFDLSNTQKLFIQITMTVLTLLTILFIIFTLSIINTVKKNRRIFSVAYYDEVTGLPNLRYLRKVLENHDHKDLALIIINPLHFKYKNLIYGYRYGDSLLSQIAQSLTSIIPSAGTLGAYRFTDDHFILTVENYGPKETLPNLCNQILARNAEHATLRSIDLTLGVVEWQKDTLDLESLIKKASIALNATNESNRIQFYTKQIEEKIQRQDTIEGELKAVIAGQEGILSLVYQPIVRAEDSFIISFEALARMQSSTLGSVPPLEFIGIAEERHLIIPLGLAIFRQVASFMRKLTDLGYGSYPVGVNVAAMQLLDETFVQELLDLTKKAGIVPQQLEMELTESVFTGNFEALTQQMERIHALGIRIAIDDFGTGFSSLNRLENLAVDTLKLDKQFVDKLIDSASTGISSDIISMGHHLGKHIIAEGVETEEQRQRLVDMGCDFMQGYLFSRPVGEEEVIRLLLEQTGN